MREYLGIVRKSIEEVLVVCVRRRAEPDLCLITKKLKTSTKKKFKKKTIKSFVTCWNGLKNNKGFASLAGSNRYSSTLWSCVGCFVEKLDNLLCLQSLVYFDWYIAGGCRVSLRTIQRNFITLKCIYYFQRKRRSHPCFRVFSPFQQVMKLLFEFF